MLDERAVKNIAKLARIGLKDNEILTYQKDISSILDYFEKLKEIDTEEVEPIGHIAETENVIRKDKEEENIFFDKKLLVDQSPDKKDGFVKVKSVF